MARSDYEVTIGIEVHVQLNTNSKIFCSCANTQSDQPNTNICHICTGQPGVLPVLNKAVVESGIKAGLATNCTITRVNEFARKHYFYPDLPKNYQITQSDKPICTDDYVAIRLEDGSIKKIRVMRIHMEEDAGKNIHAPLSNESFVDFNRTGTPLLEIVTQPDITNSYEARAYLKALRSIVMYLDICSGNMEEGAFRADTNISIRKKGAPKLGTRVELKNINSFKFISDAIEYEIDRQAEMLDRGERITQETRLWNTKEGRTEIMRSKEEAADYRYLPDPDLPIIVIDDTWITNLQKTLPELPDQKFERFLQQGLSAYEAEILINELELADYYDQARKHTNSTALINWLLRDVMGYLKDKKIALVDFLVTPARLAALVELIDKEVINNRAGQEVFALVAQTGKEPAVIVKEQGLEQMGNSAELEAIIDDIIASNPQQVGAYKNGNEKLFGFFVGQAMTKTKGKGSPKLINELLKKKLS